MPVAFSMREYAGGRPSQSSVARRPSPCTPTLLGTEGVRRCCVCYVVDFCLYAAVLRMERCADLVSRFFNIYGGILCRSSSWILDHGFWILWCFFDVFLMYASVPCSGFFPVFLWRPALHPPHKSSKTSPTASAPGPMPPSSGVPLSIHLNKKAPVPSKYNIARHQSQKNK